MAIKPKAFPIGLLLGIGIPTLSFTGTVLVKVWAIADMVATKSELALFRTDIGSEFKRTDEAIAKSVAASKQYTDEKAIQVRNESFDHSDKNRADMRTDTAEIRGQLALILNLLTPSNTRRVQR